MTALEIKGHAKRYFGILIGNGASDWSNKLCVTYKETVKNRENLVLAVFFFCSLSGCYLLFSALFSSPSSYEENVVREIGTICCRSVLSPGTSNG